MAGTPSGVASLSASLVKLTGMLKLEIYVLQIN